MKKAERWISFSELINYILSILWKFRKKKLIEKVNQYINEKKLEKALTKDLKEKRVKIGIRITDFSNFPFSEETEKKGSEKIWRPSKKELRPLERNILEGSGIYRCNDYFVCAKKNIFLFLLFYTFIKYKYTFTNKGRENRKVEEVKREVRVIKISEVENIILIKWIKEILEGGKR